MAKKSRTRQARQRRRNMRRQNQRLLILVLIVAVAVIGIAVLVVSNQPVDAFIPDDLSARYEGIRRGESRDGYPQLGDPDAPVTVEEYASFACPGCQAFHSDSFDAVLERVKREQVLFTYVPLNTGSIPNAPGASRAALCAGRQGMFWEMHDVLFDWQTRYGNTAFSQNRLLTGVENLGLSSASFTNCFNSAGITATLDAAAGEGVSSTPTIRVNGVTLESGQGVGIPSAATILQAIDDATPDDWWTRDAESEPEQADPVADESEAAEAPADDEAEESAGESTAVPADASDEADNEVDAAPEPADATAAPDNQAESAPAAEQQEDSSE